MERQGRISGHCFELFGRNGTGRGGLDVYTLSRVGLCAAGGSGEAHDHDRTRNGRCTVQGFIQARQALREAGQELGAAHLYFGCRNPEQDFLYREEFERAEQEGLVTLHTAFSRVNGAEKCYVQHLMKKTECYCCRCLRAEPKCTLRRRLPDGPGSGTNANFFLSGASWRKC